MSKPTPGPWAVHRWFPHVVVPATDIDKAIGGCVDPNREAEQYAKQIAGRSGTEYPEFHRSRVLPEEALANARLIAAAPELLEALERLKKAADALAASIPGDDLGPICEELDRADEQASTAIAKAKGEA